ncbi:PhzF family phenazine biosynthesis protein [Fodinibius sp.]|uniref:PhzF family phenazine biosynthesis protein n=1 Tax=Fodinibius sp. TaxID=1872440 RepID=UPI002ACD6F39|nr:PhzF family phenazine biosynthesis protein [Fodinibius sp.]MDZ7658224.1 PhzF family phenazine biosynthesis protein [Fodinibius sp.]
MKLPIYQVDAFASEPFEGNPAAVCPLDEWLPDDLMQNIAMENNLSETAFFVEQDGNYRLRWFTPTTEVDLCGHATLASAHVLFEHLNYDQQIIRFDSNSGELKVRKEGDRLVMNFPAAELNRTESPEFLEEAVGIPAKELYRDTDYLYVIESEEQVRNLDPDIRAMAKADVRGIIVTAPGQDYDFVSRFFAPNAGVDEDPVTGSAHTMLTPYWSKRLGKKKLVGRQVSRRGGTVYCHYKENRVEIAGEACTIMKGQFKI